MLPHKTFTIQTNLYKSIDGPKQLIFIHFYNGLFLENST